MKDNCTRHDEMLDDHETRIQNLEKADVKLFERMDNLIAQMQVVTGWIKWLIITIILSLGGFFIWYIQSLPRG